MRTITGRWLDEDWTLVLLGVGLILMTGVLAGLAAWTVHQRSAALGDATAAAQRLDVGGPDDQLYQRLIAMQQDAVALFQAPVDPGQAPLGNQPGTDLALAEGDLASLRTQFTGSSEVQQDISLISQELARYASVEATAQADNEQGLPVGAAYLREASGYLARYTLPVADDIRQVDQAQVNADDSAATAVPWALLVLSVASLAFLVGAQVVVARYTRCLFDPLLLLSTVATGAVIAGSVAFVTVTAHKVDRAVSPHAATASALAEARVDGTSAHVDDLLTLADHGEDCGAAQTVDRRLTDPVVYNVSCSFETQVVSSLSPPHACLLVNAAAACLLVNLAAAGDSAPDQFTRDRVAAAESAAAEWLTAERALPTLQNLAVDAATERRSDDDQVPREDPLFEKVLARYAAANQQAAGAAVGKDAELFDQADQAAIEHEWSSFESQAARVSAPLAWVVPGALLFGLLAVAAAGSGLGLRAAEYWWPAGRRERHGRAAR